MISGMGLVQRKLEVFPGVYQLELVTIYGYRLMRITDGSESIQNIFLCANEECFFVMNGYGLISLLIP